MARSVSRNKQYLGPAVFSIALHIGFAALVLINWPALSTPETVQPHLQAMIVDEDMLKRMQQNLPKPEPVKPKVEPEKSKPEEDTSRKEMEEALKRVEEGKKAAEAAEKKKQEAIALQKKQDAKKKKQDEIKKRQAEKEQAEAKRLAAQEKEKVQRKLAEAKQREEEERKREEEEKRLEIEQRKAMKKKLIEEREKAKREKARQEELLLQREALQLEQMMQQQQQQDAAAKQLEHDQTELEKYQALILESIKRKWFKRDDYVGLVAQIKLKLLPNGELLSATIAKSSGKPAFDQSALSAAFAVKKYPVPGDNRLFEKEFRNMTLVFKPQ